MSINLNTQYPTGSDAPSAEWPYGEPRNITSPGDGLGTPWEVALVKDIVGFQQALLTAAGIVPSGSADTALVSQYMQAIVEQAAGRASRFEDSGAANAYVLSVQAGQHAPGGLFDGLRITFRATNANTGVAATANLSGLGAVSIKLADGTTNPAAGDIPTDEDVTLIYRSTGPVFELLPLESLPTDNAAAIAANAAAIAANVIDIAANTAAVGLQGTSNLKLNTKVIDIGDWAMNGTATASVAHGLTLSKIRDVSVLIRHDLATESHPLDGAYGASSVDATNVDMERFVGGVFESLNFNSTSFNRGWITIKYTD